MRVAARMELEPGMTLGEDVAVQDTVLFPAGTVLTANNIEKLKQYSVMCVTIMEDVDFAVTHYEKLRYSEDFKLFEQKHAANQAIYKQLITDFATFGKLIPEQSLMDIYNDLRSTYSSEAMLLDYLYNLTPNEDELTFNHMLNSALLAGAFAEWASLPETEQKNMILAGFYYDIGKLKLPYEVLWRPGKLTPEEFEIVKKHPAIGWAMLGNAGLDPYVQDAVLMHHERMDGSGYPHQCRGEEINIYARYIAIVDTYIAMASPRPHRSALTPLQIVGHLERDISKYDAEILVPLMQRIANAQIGSKVCLSNETIWEVFILHPDRLSRPILKNEDSDILDLVEHPELEIVKMM